MTKWKISSVVLLLAGLFCLLSGCEQKTDLTFYETEMDFGTDTTAAAEQETESRIYVDVCGAVKNPGVYELSEGERAFRAIELAGGMLPEAAKDAVNQAAMLEDGQQLYVPFAGENGSGGSAAADGKVNLNTADCAELMTLPGVGESRALAIIAYREEHGRFSSIEEIKNISGIGDAVFEKMKDKIRV